VPVQIDNAGLCRSGKAGYKRLTYVTVHAPMPPMGEAIKTSDQLWKISDSRPFPGGRSHRSSAQSFLTTSAGNRSWMALLVLCGWTMTGLLEMSCVGISDPRKSMTLFTLAESLADICERIRDVRFTPESRHTQSRH
jgi:hypothetical protein